MSATTSNYVSFDNNPIYPMASIGVIVNGSLAATFWGRMLLMQDQGRPRDDKLTFMSQCEPVLASFEEVSRNCPDDLWAKAISNDRHACTELGSLLRDSLMNRLSAPDYVSGELRWNARGYKTNFTLLTGERNDDCIIPGISKSAPTVKIQMRDENDWTQGVKELEFTLSGVIDRDGVKEMATERALKLWMDFPVAPNALLGPHVKCLCVPNTRCSLSEVEHAMGQSLQTDFERFTRFIAPKNAAGEADLYVTEKPSDAPSYRRDWGFGRPSDPMLHARFSYEDE